MKCQILHESAGRMRVHIVRTRMTLAQADQLEYYLAAQPGVTEVKVYDRTGDAVIRYRGARSGVIRALAHFAYDRPDVTALVPDQTGRALGREYEDQLAGTVMRRYLWKLLMPLPLRHIRTVLRAIRCIAEGLKCLLRGRIEVPVLDAAAIAVSVLRGDFETASSVMFLLHIGEILEEWTHKKSVDDLARTMSLGVEKVWRLTDGQEILVPLSAVETGDSIVVRTGSMIGLDGVVISGEAMVNQSSMTGESVPVRKTAGGYVYAGTVVEEGSCVIRIEKTAGTGRYDRIVRMIEESEKLKSAAEDRASHLADRLVPWSLGATLAMWLITRNPTKALAILMVDFSCALKLAMPVSVLSAMREASGSGISVKGGRFLEAVAEADTIVFDKTGTLTYAAPQVDQVIPFGGNDETEMLRLAACLEEHYPHPIANAVVEAAAKRGLLHEEKHSEVQYVVAHGISSSIGGEKVVIGSYHFIFEDEACVIPAGEQAQFEALPRDRSLLYMAIGGQLAAVICISDPLRSESAEVIAQLHASGFERIVLMTGDSKRVAKRIAAEVGVDELYYEVLPEDKAAFIRREHEAGRKVIMIGDGVNDSPALSEADAGIAVSTGAAIAREIADITVSAEDLSAIVTLKQLSDALMARIHRNYRTIIGFNFGLIVLGAAGILQPAVTAFLHNASTLAISMHGMTALLPERHCAKSINSESDLCAEG